jgi:hypothetical protein
MSANAGISENRTLRLENVLSIDIRPYLRSLKTDDLGTPREMKIVQNQMRDFYRYTEHKYRPQGPFIVKTGMKTDKKGRRIHTKWIMVQTEIVPRWAKDPFSFNESLVVQNCLHSGYRGDISMFWMRTRYSISMLPLTASA